MTGGEVSGAIFFTTPLKTSLYIDGGLIKLHQLFEV